MGCLRHSLLAIGALAGLVGAWPAPASAEFCPPQCPSGKVPLGISLPMSGAVAPIGRTSLKAAEIAVRAVNAAGGLAGVPVELAVGDDRCDDGLAPAIAKRHIAENKIKFLIGPLCPAVATIASPIYSAAGVVQLVPTVTMVELTRRNLDNIFRIAANDEQDARALAAYLASEYQGRRLVVVHGDAFFRRAKAEAIRIALPASLREAARFERLQEVPGAGDRLADKLQRDPPDIIFMALGSAQVDEFVGKLRKRGVKSVLIGGQHLLSQSFWQQARSATEGIFAIAPIASLTDPQFRDAVEVLKQGGVVPDLVALYSYVAVQSWAEAVRRAGDGDPKKVIQELRSGRFLTALGPIAFDEKGDRRDIGYSMVTWQRGPLTELRLVKRIVSASPVPSAPPAPPVASAPPAASTPPAPGTPLAAGKPAAAVTPEEIIRFDQPVPFGPPPVYHNTIKQLADGVPLFPPIQGQSELMWKRNCSNCHAWDRHTLCQQGESYATHSENVLRQQHPFGGPFKLALLRWFKGGCL